jgi:hypothetical protein
MCLRFFFLLITQVASWLWLSRREEAGQTAEILILRHQLAVLQRRRPRRGPSGLCGPNCLLVRCLLASEIRHRRAGEEVIAASRR